MLGLGRSIRLLGAEECSGVGIAVFLEPDAVFDRILAKINAQFGKTAYDSQALTGSSAHG